MKDSIIPYALIQSLAQIDNIYEMRLFGYIIAKAQSVLKLYNKDLGQINIQHAMNLVRVTMPGRYLLQKGDRNYSNIGKAFTLAHKTVEYERDGTLYHLNIIAFPERQQVGRDSNVTFVIHNELWNALLNFSKGYRLINLPTFMRLKSTYSVIMYILISQQNINFTWHIDTLKRVLGAADKPAYKRNANFLAKVVDAAKRELDALSPHTFHYSINKSGRGGKYNTITIIPWANTQYTLPNQDTEREHDLDKQRIRLEPQVIEYLEYSFGLDYKTIERMELPLSEIGSSEAQIDWLLTVREACDRTRVRNRAAYLTTALQHRRP